MKISGKIVDIYSREIYPAEISVTDGVINKIVRSDSADDIYILPGLVDSHIHIESSMVTPGSFAREAVSRGTTAVVSDPHEIANVLGIEGVRYMVRDGEKVPLKFFFGAPSCVPATPFETSGAVLTQFEIEELFRTGDAKYLSEMMNFPGVIYDDAEVISKLKVAAIYHKRIDGHAPGLSGDKLKKYIAAGITTDHECTTLEEAAEKISLGMKVLIREGSAARNMDALKPLYRTNPAMVMLCSDDLHPEMLMKGHINKLVAHLIRDGYDLFDVIRSCTLNPAEHYGLDIGLLREGQPADLILVDDLQNMDIGETWIDGVKVFDNGKVLFDYGDPKPVNRFNCTPVDRSQINTGKFTGRIRVIEAYDGLLITKEAIVSAADIGTTGADRVNDIQKIIVKDRYNDAPPAVGFIKGFGLKAGAFASSVAHDCHNIICIGTNDDDIVSAVNEVVRLKGGLAVADGSAINSLQLNIAGIMSSLPVKEVASAYQDLSDHVRSLGCIMSAPFMTLSFMALLVIPELK
ncbi:MAG: adenine deaminase, partial [Bacteroidales bacterium]